MALRYGFGKLKTERWKSVVFMLYSKNRLCIFIELVLVLKRESLIIVIHTINRIIPGLLSYILYFILIHILLV